MLGHTSELMHAHLSRCDSFPNVGSGKDTTIPEIAACSEDMPMMDPSHPVQPGHVGK